MVNYQPDLQGWADRDEDPKWMENALARVNARQRQNKRHRTRRSGSYLFYDDEFRVLLDEAALRRGNIPLSAYMRRAIAAFLAHDLGLPYTEVIKYTAKPRVSMGGILPGTQLRTHDDGLGFGPWLIEDLRELR
jgi:hypothetical protein